MIEVTLTWAEVMLAGQVALMRAVTALRNSLKNRNGDHEAFGFDRHFIGCLGEIALAKHLGLYWQPSVGKYDTVDVGHCQVRTRSSLEKPDLILHEWDDDAQPFVNALVLSNRLPVVTLLGWISAREGKQPEFWRDTIGRPGAFFFPATQLHPMNELPPF